MNNAPSGSDQQQLQSCILMCSLVLLDSHDCKWTSVFPSLWRAKNWSLNVPDSLTWQIKGDVKITSWFALLFCFFRTWDNIRKYNPLLDKVMSRNQWHIGVHQCHLILKVTEELLTSLYMVTKRRCVWIKHYHWLHFIMFLYMSNDYDYKS